MDAVTIEEFNKSERVPYGWSFHKSPNGLTVAQLTPRQHEALKSMVAFDLRDMWELPVDGLTSCLIVSDEKCTWVIAPSGEISLIEKEKSGV